MTRRTERLNDLLRAEISDVILREVKDPRLGGIISITQVRVTPDLSHARIFVSVMGNEEERSAAFKALNSARFFVRRELTHRIKMRRIPDLAFQRDDSLEQGAHLLSLIDKAREGGETPSN
jgi:ribosome-binding factor A